MVCVPQIECMSNHKTITNVRLHWRGVSWWTDLIFPAVISVQGVEVRPEALLAGDFSRLGLSHVC